MPLTEIQKQHRKARRSWVKALRSGKFKWGRGKLNPDTDKMCCLGIACVVAEKAGISVLRRGDGTISGYNLSEQPLVKQWLGLAHQEGVWSQKVTLAPAKNLADINDRSKRNPFKRVANIIESEPDGLFVD